MPCPRAFTLIELLVVITIIVVLLSLLTPALDRAIEQAELAACGVHLRTQASGYLSYAMQYRRSYPNPGARRGFLRHLRQGLDMRPLLRPYFSMDTFNDPLSESVEWDTLERQDTWLWTGVAFFINWGVQGQAALLRVGDRTNFIGDTPDDFGFVYRFNFLAGDHIEQWDAEGSWWSSHPDSKGVLQQVAFEERRPGNGDAVGIGAEAMTDAGAIAPITTSQWEGPTIRTTLDLNFAYDDGSVVCFNDVVDGTTDPDQLDERIVRIGAGDRYSGEGLADHVPKR